MEAQFSFFKKITIFKQVNNMVGDGLAKSS